MENLCQYIEKLLVLHDYVVVPNFGGFVVQQQSSRIFGDKITAPRATIGFNPLLQYGDGLLAIEISHSKKITYRQAMDFIHKEVEDLKQKIEKKEVIKVTKIGYFQKDSSENIIFTPDEEANFLPQNFCLPDLFISAKSYKTTEKHREITISFQSQKIYRYAAIALLIFALFCVTPRISDTRQSDYASFTPNNIVNSIENVSEKQIYSVENKDKQTTEIIASQIEKNYHVIVASLPSKKSADMFCNELIDNNFKDAHVLEPIKTYRIAIQSFSDKNEAIQFMEKLRKTDIRFETAWVLCK